MSRLTRLFPLLLLCAGLARADRPDGDVILREKLERIECAEFTAKVSDGPALAAALQQTLRASPGGEAINVLWRPAEPALPKSPLEADLKGLRAHALLSAVCRRANLFWGLRNGMVVLDRVPIPGTVSIPVISWRLGDLLSDQSFGSAGMGQTGEENLADKDTDAKLASMMRRLLRGVEWRGEENFSAHYEQAIHTLLLTTSEEYLPLLRQVTRDLALVPHQVSITATWVAFPAATVEKAISATDRTSLSQKDLMKLFAGTEKKILHSQTLITLSGVNGVVEAVDEIIYPTEFDCSENDVSIIGARDLEKDVPYRYAMNTVIPGGFETRQIGGILNVPPTINPDNETINLCLIPEIAELAGWIQYGYEPKPPPDKIEVPGVHMPQPTFRSHNVTTTVNLRDGSTLVLSGGRDPESGEYIYCYITAELLDTEGKELR